MVCVLTPEPGRFRSKNGMLDKDPGEEYHPRKPDCIERRLPAMTNVNIIYTAAIFACAMTMTSGDPPGAVGA